jgi:hypothetical protein
MSLSKRMLFPKEYELLDEVVEAIDLYSEERD